jgi:signal transduction histidine kinase/PAS domain-containing protein/ActR/RegA family two-component response regulator
MGESPDKVRLSGTVVLFTGVLGVLLAIMWLLYRMEAGRIADQQAQRETTRAELLTTLLQSELQPVTDDLRLLVDGDGLRSWLDTGDPRSLQAATRRARFISANKATYDQVRFIDADGQEVIRAIRGGQIVPPDQLQNKAGNRYFQQTSLLDPGGLYLSAMSLNAEGSQVEIPFKPVLRLAMPVFDSAGRRRGIYIINYLSQTLFEKLQNAVPTSSHRLRLLNAEGYWLKAADASQEWGFMLPERAAFTLARSDPALWSKVQEQLSGQQHSANGLFTWRRILPTEFGGRISGSLVTDDRFLLIGSEITPAEWAALFADLRRTMLGVCVSLALLTLLSAWLFHGRRKVMQTLRTMNHQLEARVRERTAELAHSYEQLQHREQLLEETGHLAKVGGWDFDPVTGSGRWTPEVARIHELDETLEPSKELGLQFYPDASRRRLEAALQKSLADGSPYDLELEFITARGAHKWVRTIARPWVRDGKVVRMRGALQDITERKQSELRLHAQLQRMHLLEQITRAIGERQDLKSIVQVVVRTIEEQLPLDFGCICLYDPASRSLTVIGVGIASMALAQELAMTESARIPIDENGLSRCVRGQLVYEADIASVEFPFPQRLAAGGLRALVAAPLQIESKVFGVLIAARRQESSFSSSDCEFLRQLSEHVALAAHQAQLHEALQGAYEDLRSSQQVVMQQERLRVLGQMASGIAHDINNAISPIMLYADSLLESEPDLSARASNGLRTIQQAASDVAATVARMREFYRQREGTGEQQPVELNRIALQMRDLTRARWETIPQQSGIVIDLQLELGEKLPPIQGVENEIREALTNLIFNAVDALPKGGRITLRTALGRNGHVDAEVIDTGTGMDAETTRRCLEPFFTTKGERGTGLGLAMVYGVMQRHGGDVQIDSTPGFGTTVRLSFVVSAAAVATQAEQPAEVPRGLTILLVDDDPILLHSLRETLELDGHTILVANGGQTGIDMFRASLQPGGKAISLVITDLGMPHVDGRSVASAVKQASPATPVLLLTGWGERLLAEGQAPPHVDRVLSKPPRLRELRGTLLELTKRTTG